ncbi:MAG: hypothetical protein AAF629_03855, partial [Chloroflexota bacterium]
RGCRPDPGAEYRCPGRKRGDTLCLPDMVSLGKNRVGWATYFMDRLTGTPEDARYYQPNCNADQIQFNVYTSPNP